MDRRLRELARAFAAAPADRELARAYTTEWIRAGAAGRDPRRDPVPGDAVLVTLPSDYTEVRVAGGTWWSQAWADALADAVLQRHGPLPWDADPRLVATNADRARATWRTIGWWRDWVSEAIDAGGTAEVLIRQPHEHRCELCGAHSDDKRFVSLRRDGRYLCTSCAADRPLEQRNPLYKPTAGGRDPGRSSARSVKSAREHGARSGCDRPRPPA